MKRPNFQEIFDHPSEFCEVSVSKPVSTFVPNQAITLKELVSRFERGQRLNVHSNFAPGSNLENITDEEALARIKAESMETDDFPPTGVFDICDVEQHYKAHQVHKREFSDRMKKKREEAKQAKQQQAKQAPDAPSQPDALAE